MGGVENVGVELLAGSLLHGEDALRDDEKGLVGDGLVRRLRHVLECAENELVGVGGARGELVVVVILLMCIISGMSLVGMTGILVNCTIVLVHVTITLRNRTITLMNTLILFPSPESHSATQLPTHSPMPIPNTVQNTIQNTVQNTAPRLPPPLMMQMP